MKKDNTNTDVEDMEAGCKSWNKKIKHETMKRDVEAYGYNGTPTKKRKTGFATYMDDVNDLRKFAKDDNKENTTNTAVVVEKKKETGEEAAPEGLVVEREEVVAE